MVQQSQTTCVGVDPARSGTQNQRHFLPRWCVNPDETLLKQVNGHEPRNTAQGYIYLSSGILHRVVPGELEQAAVTSYGVRRYFVRVR